MAYRAYVLVAIFVSTRVPWTSGWQNAVLWREGDLKDAGSRALIARV